MDVVMIYIESAMCYWIHLNARMNLCHYYKAQFIDPLYQIYNNIMLQLQLGFLYH